MRCLRRATPTHFFVIAHRRSLFLYGRARALREKLFRSLFCGEMSDGETSTVCDRFGEIGNARALREKLFRSLFCGEMSDGETSTVCESVARKALQIAFLWGGVRSQFKFLVHHRRVDLYFEVLVENNDAHDEYAQFLALAQLLH